jgi:hypothetical protein
MLKALLDTFQHAPGPMSLDILAMQLGVDRDVLAGMLGDLVRMGRLVKIDDRAGSCASCGIKGRCPYLLTTSGAYYALPSMVGPDNPCG